MVDECFNCGISGERIRFFDAISGKGIVKICKECASKENIPIVRKPSKIFTPTLYSDLNGGEKTVYERLSRMSGFDSKNKKSEEEKELLKSKKFPEEKISGQETTLKDIVDKNFKIQVKEKLKPRSDLIDNFHWVIMRVRRSKHITQEQLARAIAEPETAIKMAEQGILSKNSYKFINKLENYLGIKLVKKEFTEKIEEKPKEIGFDSITTKNLTISDLKEMKKRKEAEILGETIPFPEEVAEVKEENKREEEDLSQEEKDLIFGKSNHNL